MHDFNLNKTWSSEIDVFIIVIFWFSGIRKICSLFYKYFINIIINILSHYYIA